MKKHLKCAVAPIHSSRRLTSGTKVNIRTPHQHSLLRAEPDAVLTAAAARLIAAPWPAEASAEPVSRSSPHYVAEVGPYDVAGAFLAAGQSGFGEYENCDPRRRCVGCAGGCGDELRFKRHAADRNRTLLLVVAGGSPTWPAWLRVALIEPGCVWSGTSYVPAIYRNTPGLVLASEAGGQSFGVGPRRLAALGPQISPPWRISAIDSALHLFRSAVREQIMPVGRTLMLPAPALAIAS